jgi:predicted lipase
VALPLAEAAYNVTTATPDVPAGYTLAGPIRADKLLGKISPDNPFFGFVVYAGNVVYIAIRGTETPDEWIDDFDALLVDCGGFKIHAGFQTVFEALQPSIMTAVETAVRNGSEICVIGHSLGAAVATLVAASIASNEKTSAAQLAKVGSVAPAGSWPPVTCIVFASPRVGDVAWKAHCDANVCLVRVSNTKDIVTHVPPRPEFIHAGMTAVFDGWLNAINIGQALDAHFEHSLEGSYGPGVAKMPNALALIDLT